MNVSENLLPLNNSINGHQSVEDDDLHENQPQSQDYHCISPQTNICRKKPHTNITNNIYMTQKVSFFNEWQTFTFCFFTFIAGVVFVIYNYKKELPM